MTEISVSTSATNGTVNREEKTILVIAESSTEETPTEAVDDEPYLDTLAKDILRSVKSGDYKKAARFMGVTDEEAYRFIENMTVDSYEIMETQDLDSTSKYFKIKFNISDSGNDYFSVGESYWDLAVGGMEEAAFFRRANDKNTKFMDYHHGRISDNDYDFCFAFSFYLGIFQTATDFNTVINDDVYWDGLVHGIVMYYALTAFDGGGVYHVNTIKDYMIKTTGITDVDYTDSQCYREENNTLDCGAHGGDWLYWLPVSKDYDGNTRLYTVVIDYFADTSMLVVAKTMEYKYTVNDDGTYKMLSTELLYDSGYDIKGGAV